MENPLEVLVSKAAPILRDVEIPGTIIRIIAELPDFADDPAPCENRLTVAESFYRDEAARLAQALYLSLPQGTFDRLVLELLSKKVSLYRGRTQ